MNKPVSPAAASAARSTGPTRATSACSCGNKHAGDPSGPAGTILFVHGSSMASQPTFDLQVPGRPDSSAMDFFAARGYDTWCVDMEGYGRSDKNRDNNAPIANGADDCLRPPTYIQKLRGKRPLLVYGISSGALRAALFAQRHPELVSRLALDAMVWTGEGSPDARRAQQAAARIPREEPAPDRPRIRALHLHARPSRHRRRHRHRGLRRRHPRARQFGADRHLCRHVREPAGLSIPRRSRSPTIDHARPIRRHRELPGSASSSSRGCRTRTSSSR